MASAAVNDAYEVRINGRQDGQQTTNVWHFVCTGADPDVLTNLIQVFVSCFVDNLLPVMSANWTFEDVRWKQVSPILGPENLLVPAEAGPGGAAGPALPSLNSAVLSLRTLLGGGSRRGRKYIPGLPEAATLNSVFDKTHAFWLGAVAFAACVLLNFKPGDPPGAPSWAVSVYSRKLGGSSLPFGAAGFTAIETITPVEIVGTTRSRKVGRGS